MAEDDLLVQIETDKVTIDVRYQQKEPGVVKEFLVKMDDTVQVRLPWRAAATKCTPLCGCVAPRLNTACGFAHRSSNGQCLP